MSLRLRLCLLITLAFVPVLLVAAAYVVHAARDAVRDEVASMAGIVFPLGDAVLAEAEARGWPDSRGALIARLRSLGQGRHLRVELRRPEGQVLLPRTPVGSAGNEAPEWFARFVEPPPIEHVHPLSPDVEVVLSADPHDEIDEAWGEATGLLGLLALACLLANALVLASVGIVLRPVGAIVDGIELVHRGDYRSRLPRFALPELQRISERFNDMAGALLRTREENRYLAGRTLAIQEDERRHLARELHDELGQSITAVRASAAVLDQRGDAPAQTAARAILAVTDEMQERVARMMRRLRPAVLDEFGLLRALQEMTDDWNTRHGDAFCHFAAHGDLDDLGEATDIGVYRMVQEALTNAARHAGAEDVWVSATREAGTLVVTVRDNGRGFDPSAGRTGLGLLGMRERAEALDGRLLVDSAPGRGTTLHITLPVGHGEVPA